MENSSYWLNKKNEYEKEYDMYKNISSKLSSIKENISDAPSDLKNAERTFKDGGYYDGDTLDRGVLKENYTKLETINTNISGIITKISNKLQELQKNITICKQKYEECLKKEQD